MTISVDVWEGFELSISSPVKGDVMMFCRSMFCFYDVCFVFRLSITLFLDAFLLADCVLLALSGVHFEIGFCVQQAIASNAAILQRSLHRERSTQLQPCQVQRLFR